MITPPGGLTRPSPPAFMPRLLSGPRRVALAAVWGIPGADMKPFTLLIKPASADCNLRCDYCFYTSRLGLYPATARHRMSDETLETLIRSYMSTRQPQYVFGWQGGEPTLMGVEFFRKVTALQRRYGRPGSVVANGLQTNATLIDDELAAHLAEYKFLLGVSLDGPADVHDRYRHHVAAPGHARGEGSHSDVMRGIDCLRRHGVEFNILTLVSAANVSRGREVYRYLRDSGYAFHQYIPCVEFDADGERQPFAVSADQWGEFLCAVFDEWIAGDARRVSVRLFDSILCYYLDGVRNVCHMGRDCRQYFVVEHNGDVYPCDFFVDAGLKLGNVSQDAWEALDAGPAYEEFGLRKARTHRACRQCPHIDLCAGDCLKHRAYGGGHAMTLSWLCAGWKRFYAHALPRIKALAEEIRRRGPLPRG